MYFYWIVVVQCCVSLLLLNASWRTDTRKKLHTANIPCTDQTAKWPSTTEYHQLIKLWMAHFNLAVGRRVHLWIILSYSLWRVESNQHIMLSQQSFIPTTIIQFQTGGQLLKESLTSVHIFETCYLECNIQRNCRVNCMC